MNDMKKLWAPWRAAYLRPRAGQSSEKKCIFCAAMAAPGKKMVIAVNKKAFSVLNKYPYNNGHIMAAPRRHISDIGSLTEEEVFFLFSMLKESRALLSERLKPDGFNIGINEGRAAGAGVPGHLHIHIVPRWNGDTNFMPVTGGIKVISQSLEELLRLLKKK
jgi:ATP adenylyltransferase